jgi:hypothetical protein
LVMGGEKEGEEEAVPQLWSALLSLGWLGGGEEVEGGLMALLARTAERGAMGYV